MIAECETAATEATKSVQEAALNESAPMSTTQDVTETEGDHSEVQPTEESDQDNDDVSLI